MKKKSVSSFTATFIALEQLLENISSQQTHNEMHKNEFYNIIINKSKQICQKDIKCLELNHIISCHKRQLRRSAKHRTSPQQLV